MNTRTILFSLGLLVACIVGGYLYMIGGRYVSTDNAYLKFDKVTLSAEVSGKIASISVATNQRVERGDLLITLDDAIYKAALEKAEARLKKAESTIQSLRASYHTKQAELALAESNLEFANKEYQRELNLSRKKMTSETLVDDRKHNLDTANENRTIIERELSQLLARLGGRADALLNEYPEVMEAQAGLDLARIDLEHTKIVAPFDGFVSHLPNPGQHIDPGRAMLSLVSDRDAWIEANFKETELENLYVDQPVDITIDAYPDHRWNGVVQSIGAATGAEHSVLPPQNATGNWIKVVQRIPVRVSLKTGEGDPILRAGMSVSVRIDTRPPAQGS